MIFFNSLQVTVAQIFILIGPGLVLAVLMNFVAGEVEKKANRLLGRRLYLWCFGWLGTAVHETGHALACLLFGHKIVKIDLFNLDPNSPTQGQVEHSYNPKNLYHIIGNFFIGIGPILLGTVVIYIAAYLLLTDSFAEFFADLQITHKTFTDFSMLQEFGTEAYSAFTDFLGNTFSLESFKNWRFYVFCYLLFSIGSSMKLSPPDVHSASRGFLVITVLIYLINLTLVFLQAEDLLEHISSITAFYTAFYTAMLFALLFNLLVLILLIALSPVIGVIRR